jgi:hypothetical protein
MSARLIITPLIIITCCGFLAATFRQTRELLHLRAQEHALLTPAETSAESSPSTQNGTAAAPEVSTELLQLRNEVSQLKRRRDELAAAKAENQRLRSQLSSRPKTNAGSLVPGYIRKTQAQFVGYSTPENTVQSFLWAIKSKDPARLLQAFTPEAAQHFQAEMKRTGDGNSFFEEATALVGLGIVSNEPVEPGVIKIGLQVVPELPTMHLPMRQIDNEWKLDWPPR